MCIEEFDGPLASTISSTVHQELVALLRVIVATRRRGPITRSVCGRLRRDSLVAVGARLQIGHPPFKALLRLDQRDTWKVRSVPTRIAGQYRPLHDWGVRADIEVR